MGKLILFLVILMTLSGCSEEEAYTYSTEELFKMYSPWYSLDGNLKLNVDSEHGFIISDAYKKIKDSKTLIKGKWEIDENNHSVSLNFGDRKETLHYIEPNNDTTSILIMGSIKDADLTKSWFSSLNDKNDDETSYNQNEP